MAWAPEMQRNVAYQGAHNYRSMSTWAKKDPSMGGKVWVDYADTVAKAYEAEMAGWDAVKAGDTPAASERFEEALDLHHESIEKKPRYLPNIPMSDQERRDLELEFDFIDNRITDLETATADIRGAPKPPFMPGITSQERLARLQQIRKARNIEVGKRGGKFYTIAGGKKVYVKE